MKNIIYICIVTRRKEGKPGKWTTASENKENGQKIQAVIIIPRS